jgi:hypothetical protein
MDLQLGFDGDLRVMGDGWRWEMGIFGIGIFGGEMLCCKEIVFFQFFQYLFLFATTWRMSLSHEGFFEVCCEWASFVARRWLVSAL